MKNASKQFERKARGVVAWADTPAPTSKRLTAGAALAACGGGEAASPEPLTVSVASAPHGVPVSS